MGTSRFLSDPFDIGRDGSLEREFGDIGSIFISRGAGAYGDGSLFCMAHGEHSGLPCGDEPSDAPDVDAKRCFFPDSSVERRYAIWSTDPPNLDAVESDELYCGRDQAFVFRFGTIGNDRPGEES